MANPVRAPAVSLSASARTKHEAAMTRLLQLVAAAELRATQLVQQMAATAAAAAVAVLLRTRMRVVLGMRMSLLMPMQPAQALRRALGAAHIVVV